MVQSFPRAESDWGVLDGTVWVSLGSFFGISVGFFCALRCQPCWAELIPLCPPQASPTASPRDSPTASPGGGGNTWRSFCRRGGGNFGDSLSWHCSKGSLRLWLFGGYHTRGVWSVLGMGMKLCWPTGLLPTFHCLSKNSFLSADYFWSQTPNHQERTNSREWCGRKWGEWLREGNWWNGNHRRLSQQCTETCTEELHLWGVTREWEHLWVFNSPFLWKRPLGVAGKVHYVGCISRE